MREKPLNKRLSQTEKKWLILQLRLHLQIESVPGSLVSRALMDTGRLFPVSSSLARNSLLSSHIQLSFYVERSQYCITHSKGFQQISRYDQKQQRYIETTGSKTCGILKKIYKYQYTYKKILCIPAISGEIRILQQISL